MHAVGHIDVPARDHSRRYLRHCSVTAASSLPHD